MIDHEFALPNLLSWVTKGGLAILDQALFAGANFLVNIFLARWLTPTEYGAFALAYSIFLLLGAFHTAILTEPMMDVIGSAVGLIFLSPLLAVIAVAIKWDSRGPVFHRGLEK